jgi:hypothetical protein
MSRRVFLSYSAQDRVHADSVNHWLQASGLFPAEVADPINFATPADDVRTVIRNLIGRSDALLLLWSKSAVESPWVQYEIGMAQALGKPIVVVLAGGSPSALPEGLADAPHVELERGSA